MILAKLMRKSYLGIDIGGTYTRIVLLKGLRQQKPRFLKIKTGKTTREVEKGIHGLIEQITGGDTKKLAGIGIGIAGSVDRKKGIFLRNDNMPFHRGWEPRRFLRKFGVPVMVYNDAECFLRAEWLWGAGRGRRNVVGVVIGTGIGGAMIIDGKMVYGAHDRAGEVGFMIMDEKNARVWDSLGAKKAFQRHGDRSRITGLGIASLINILDPEIVVLGGGGVYSPAFHLEKVRKIVQHFIITPGANHAPIVKGKLGDAAQAIGAALLFAD